MQSKPRIETFVGIQFYEKIGDKRFFLISPSHDRVHYPSRKIRVSLFDRLSPSTGEHPSVSCSSALDFNAFLGQTSLLSSSKKEHERSSDFTRYNEQLVARRNDIAFQACAGWSFETRGVGSAFSKDLL